MGLRSYFGRVLIAIDQLFNVVVLNGFPDETASSNWGRHRKHGDDGAGAACAVLDAIQENHCGMSIEETPTGDTDAHHLGRVIRELPRDPSRWRKLGVLALSVFLLSGCHIIAGDCRIYGCSEGQTCSPDGDGTIWKCSAPAPTPSPSPLPSGTPSPAPTPKPSPSPTPKPSPSATPPPSPSPAPSPSPLASPKPSPSPSGAPPFTESGNYPVPALNSCPPWFAGATTEVGISVLSQRKCAGQGAPPDCTITNLNATEKSLKPHCEHSCYDEAGNYSLSNCRNKCETWGGCQQPEFVNGNSGIQMLISHPSWGGFDVCDKRTADCDLPDCRRNFICHDQAINRHGDTLAKACMPDGSKCGPVHPYRSLP